MTKSLFSQLVAELGSDLSPTGLQKDLLSAPRSGLTWEQQAGLFMYWHQVSEVSSRDTMVNPSAAMMVMAAIPEPVDHIDEFLFI